MNCIEEILVRLRENRMNETTFVYNGAEYSNRYGNYQRNHQRISRSEYHNARKKLIAQKDKEGSLSQRVNAPYKEFATQIEKFQKFISELSYDKSYKVSKPKRGHLARIDPYDEDSRIDQIMKDTTFSEEEAYKFNKIVSEYTSTNNYTRFNSDEKELFDRYIDESPIYSPPPVFRGLGFRKRLGNDSLGGYDTFLNIEEGTTITFQNYTSFSSNPDLAIEFAYDNGDHQVYLVNTKNLTGVSIDHLSSIDYEEDELVYKADCKMTVLNKVIDGNTIYLHVEEVSLLEDNEDNIVEVPVYGSMYIESKEGNI